MGNLRIACCAKSSYGWPRKGNLEPQLIPALFSNICRLSSQQGRLVPRDLCVTPNRRLLTTWQRHHNGPNPNFWLINGQASRYIASTNGERRECASESLRLLDDKRPITKTKEQDCAQWNADHNGTFATATAMCQDLTPVVLDTSASQELIDCVRGIPFQLLTPCRCGSFWSRPKSSRDVLWCCVFVSHILIKWKCLDQHLSQRGRLTPSRIVTPDYQLLQLYEICSTFSSPPLLF